MDGTKRSSLRRGLRVAIVLKEDQQTGRRTIGEIGQILTPSETHHRGIKVRLTDGQVGRVQEILGPAVRKQEAPRQAQLAVLLVERPDGSLYARRIEPSPGIVLVALGLDRSIRSNETATEAARLLYAQVTQQLEAPRAIFSAPVKIQQQLIALSAFACKGNEVHDDQQADWDWTGWLLRSEISKLHACGQLSEESAVLYLKMEQV